CDRRMKKGGEARPPRARARTPTASVRAGPVAPTPAASPPRTRASFPSPASDRAGVGSRRQPPARAATSFEREAEEAVTGAGREEVLGAGKACQEIGEVRSRWLVRDGQVLERRPDRLIEEASQLHECPPSSAEASRFDHSRSLARLRRPVC